MTCSTVSRSSGGYLQKNEIFATHIDVQNPGSIFPIGFEKWGIVHDARGGYHIVDSTKVFCHSIKDSSHPFGVRNTCPS